MIGGYNSPPYQSPQGKMERICPKCDGFVAYDSADREWFCVNCGTRFYPGLAVCTCASCLHRSGSHQRTTARER